MNEHRPCPICNANSNYAKPFIEKNIDTSKLSRFSFASRKEPEFMCYNLVQCTICDLVYANTPPGINELAKAYHLADYDSSEEADDAAKAYLHAIQPTLTLLPRQQSALEIGTGTGIFLEHLAHLGFTELAGIEPSAAAIAAAPHNRQAWIKQGMFNAAAYKPNSFDLIGCFMTMEHVHDPHSIATATLQLLRPGGAFVIVTHDYRSLINRLLKTKSPIIDIEHLQLFSQHSTHHLFKSVGYENITVSTFYNTYSLQYWLRLTPIPKYLKSLLLKSLHILGLLRTKLTINVGNTMTVGFKKIKD